MTTYHIEMKPGDVVWLTPWHERAGAGMVDPGRIDRAVLVWPTMKYGEAHVKHFCVCRDGYGWAAIGFDAGWRSPPFPTREAAQSAAETFVAETWGQP